MSRVAAWPAWPVLVLSWWLAFSFTTTFSSSPIYLRAMSGQEQRHNCKFVRRTGNPLVSSNDNIEGNSLWSYRAEREASQRLVLIASPQSGVSDISVRSLNLNRNHYISVFQKNFRIPIWKISLGPEFNYEMLLINFYNFTRFVTLCPNQSCHSLPEPWGEGLRGTSWWGMSRRYLASLGGVGGGTSAWLAWIGLLVYRIALRLQNKIKKN